MTFCINSRGFARWHTFALIAAICFATGCSRGPDTADQNNGDHDQGRPKQRRSNLALTQMIPDRKTSTRKTSTLNAWPGTKAGDERSFGEASE